MRARPGFGFCLEGGFGFAAGLRACVRDVVVRVVVVRVVVVDVVVLDVVVVLVVAPVAPVGASVPPPGVPAPATGAARAPSTSASARARSVLREGVIDACGSVPPVPTRSGRQCRAEWTRAGAPTYSSAPVSPLWRVCTARCIRAPGAGRRIERRSARPRSPPPSPRLLGPLFAQRQLPGGPRAKHACRVRMAATARIAVGEQEHVRGERRQQPVAQRAAIGGRLEVLGRADLPPRRGRKAHRRCDG